MGPTVKQQQPNLTDKTETDPASAGTISPPAAAYSSIEDLRKELAAGISSRPLDAEAKPNPTATESVTRSPDDQPSIDDLRRELARSPSAKNLAVEAALSSREDKQAKALEELARQRHDGNITERTYQGVVRSFENGDITTDEVMAIAQNAERIRDANWMEKRFEEGGSKFLSFCTSKEAYDNGNLLKRFLQEHPVEDSAAIKTVRMLNALHEEIARTDDVFKEATELLRQQQRIDDTVRHRKHQESLTGITRSLEDFGQGVARQKRAETELAVGDARNEAPGNYVLDEEVKRELARTQGDRARLQMGQPQTQLVDADQLKHDLAVERRKKETNKA